MSNLSIQLTWNRTEAELLPGQFSNAHTIDYNDLYVVRGDAAADWGGNPDNANPEQALAAALSSCHMMTFLALAAKVKWPVASYQDHAEAHLGKNQAGKMAVTGIDLRPAVTFDAGFSVDDEQMQKMHERAHRYCFIANSLAESVTVNVL